MPNYKVSGKDNITAELIYYFPDILDQTLADSINSIFSKHNNIDVGMGVLKPLQKPCKRKEPMENFRPILYFL